MTQDEAIKYLTTAEWLRGYVDGLADKEKHSALIYRMILAADLLMAVWEENRPRDFSDVDRGEMLKELLPHIQKVFNMEHKKWEGEIPL
jgi:hypothetical protein